MARAAKLGEPASRLLRPQHRRQWQVESGSGAPALLQGRLTASQALLRAPSESKSSFHPSKCCFCSQRRSYCFIRHLQAAQPAHVILLETTALRADLHLWCEMYHVLQSCNNQHVCSFGVWLGKSLASEDLLAGVMPPLPRVQPGPLVLDGADFLVSHCGGESWRGVLLKRSRGIYCFMDAGLTRKPKICKQRCCSTLACTLGV